MSISFPAPADVVGLRVLSLMPGASSAHHLTVQGFRGSARVGSVSVADLPQRTKQWVELGFQGVDRLSFQAQARVQGAAWYGLDDLVFERGGRPSSLELRRLVLRGSSGWVRLRWLAVEPARVPSTRRLCRSTNLP